MQSVSRFPLYSSSSPDASHFKKDRPYFSDKHDSLFTNENGRHHFPNGEEIVCRHLASQYIIEVFSDPKGKVDFDYFKEDGIPGHVRGDIETIYQHRCQMSDDTRLINNNQLGMELCAVFEQMEKAHPPQTVGAAYLESTDHSMAIRLRIKEDIRTRQKTYVVSFYDPNKTATPIRIAESETTGLPNLCSLTTKDLLGEQNDKSYFQDSNTSLLIPIDWEKLQHALDCVEHGVAIDLPAREPGKIGVSYTKDTLHPHHVLYLMIDNFHENIKQIASDLKGLVGFNQNKLLRIIEGRKDDKGLYALNRALQKDSNYQSIEAYAELLQLVPAQKRAQVLEKVTEDGLAHALADGYSKNIEAYKKLLTSVPLEQRKKILMAMSAKSMDATLGNADGSVRKIKVNSLELALNAGHFDAIKKYAELFALAPGAVPISNDRVRAAYKNAIKAAVEKGDLNGINACKELLKLVPENERVNLLMEINTDNIASAFQNNNLKIIDLYIDLLTLLPERKREQFIAPITASLKAFGLSKLQFASINVCKKLLNLLHHDRRAELLDSMVGDTLEHALLFGHADALAVSRLKKELRELPDGGQVVPLKTVTTKGLQAALKNGNADFIKVYKDLLVLLPEKRRKDVLIDTTGIALKEAIESGRLESVNAYKELLLLIPLEERTELLIRVTQFGIQNALANNNVAAIMAYKELLAFLPEDKRAILLGSVIKNGMEDAFRNGHVAVIQALGELLKLVPAQYRKDAYIPIRSTKPVISLLPTERYQENFFNAFNSATPATKSAFMEMLGKVSFALLDHFIQSKMIFDAQIRGEVALDDEVPEELLV